MELEREYQENIERVKQEEREKREDIERKGNEIVTGLQKELKVLSEFIMALKDTRIDLFEII